MQPVQQQQPTANRSTGTGNGWGWGVGVPLGVGCRRAVATTTQNVGCRLARHVSFRNALEQSMSISSPPGCPPELE